MGQDGELAGCAVTLRAWDPGDALGRAAPVAAVVEGTVDMARSRAAGPTSFVVPAPRLRLASAGAALVADVEATEVVLDVGDRDAWAIRGMLNGGSAVDVVATGTLGRVARAGAVSRLVMDVSLARAVGREPTAADVARAREEAALR